MSNKISDKDKRDWENFLSNNEKLSDKEEHKRKNFKKTRTFDLHGYSLDDANKKINDLINNSFKKGLNKLIIITGKGLHSQNEKDPYVSKDLGILRYSVPEYIKNNFELMKMIREINDAEIKDGGAGAFYIYLKKKL